jgi:hypothetical protein
MATLRRRGRACDHDVTIPLREPDRRRHADDKPKIGAVFVGHRIAGVAGRGAMGLVSRLAQPRSATGSETARIAGD